MNISLIITTYNWPQALSRVLSSVMAQVEQPLEVVIADDGSSEETRKIVESFKHKFKIPLIHCWQEDLGFRAAEIRNKAIAASSGDYIVAIDGDMLLHPYFIADHRRAAERNYFVQGSRVIMSQVATERFFSSPRTCPNLFWSGVSNRLNGIRLPFVSAFFKGEATRLSGIKTCNFAFWRDAALAVNGFNNEFVGWGREDSDFSVRLINSGEKRKNLKGSGVAFHIYHEENTRASLQENDLRLQQAIDNKLVRCSNGVSEFL